jgi:hypothetical protein
MVAVVERVAVWDSTLTAVLSGLRPLTYAQQHLPQDYAKSWDIPPFVRSASALRRWGDVSVVVQDDVSALAVTTGNVTTPWLLPSGVQGRRRFESAQKNKKHKLDLEAAVVLPDGRLLVFGSGSTPAREQLVLLEPSGALRVIDGAALYSHLRAETAFSGSELNIEGAVVQAGALLLVQRGNGAVLQGRQALNALGALPLTELVSWLDGNAAAPALTHITRAELGALGGTPVSFTDAALGSSGDIAFVACAEDSRDVVADGAVSGVCFGWFGAAGVCIAAITDENGDLSRLKLEGIEPVPNEPLKFDVVADVDDAAAPAWAGTLQVSRAGCNSQ